MANLTGTLNQLREQRRMAQRQVDKLDEAISAIEGLVGKGSNTGAPRKRVLSAAGRRRIAMAQKARWAKFKQQRKAA
jgi:hypothetical protein